MARLGRGQPRTSAHSFFRGPTVLGPPSGPPVALGLNVKLAPPLTGADLARRATHYKLSPPAVVNQPPVQTKIKVTLAAKSYRPKATSKLAPPATLEAGSQPPVETKIKVTLARAIRSGTTYFGIIPVVVDPPVVPPSPPVSTTLRVTLAKFWRTSVRSKLSPPTTLEAASPVEAELRITLAKALRAQVKSRLSPPATLEVLPGDPPVVSTLRVTLAPRRQEQRYRTIYFGIIPTAVNPPVAGQPPVETKLRTYLARALPLRHPRYRLSPPTVVDPPAAGQPPVDAKTRVTLAKQPPIGYKRWRKAGYSLSGPLVVVVYPLSKYQTSLRTTLTAKLRVLRRAKSFLRTSAILDPPLPPPVETKLRVQLAAKAYRPRTKSEFSPPTVVAEPAVPPVETTLRVALVPSRDPARRFAKSKLRAPTVVIPAPPPVETTLRVQYVRLPRNAPLPLFSSFLRPPTVVGPFVPPVVPPPTVAPTFPRTFREVRRRGAMRRF